MSVLDDLYLRPWRNGGSSTRERRMAALLEQCRRLRAQLHGAIEKLHEAQAERGARLLTLEAALRDIANPDECTTFYACQRRAQRALERR